MKSEGHAVHSEGRPSRWSAGYRPPRAPAGEAGDADMATANPDYSFAAHGDPSQAGHNAGERYPSRLGIPRGQRLVTEKRAIGDYTVVREWRNGAGALHYTIRCKCGTERSIQRSAWIGDAAPANCRRCRQKARRECWRDDVDCQRVP